MYCVWPSCTFKESPRTPQELPRTSQGTKQTLKDALATPKASQEQLQDPHGENKNKQKTKFILEKLKMTWKSMKTYEALKHGCA